MTNSVRYAIEVSEGDFSQDCEKWLQEHLANFFKFGGTLEENLSLTGADRTKYSDFALRRAAVQLKGNRSVSTWCLAGELSKALSRYEPFHGRRKREHLSPLHQALFDVVAADSKGKRSQRRLYDLLS